MKLVFAYIVAEYSTPKNGKNMVTLWDQPVKSFAKSNIVCPSESFIVILSLSSAQPYMIYMCFILSMRYTVSSLLIKSTHLDWS